MKTPKAPKPSQEELDAAAAQAAETQARQREADEAKAKLLLDKKNAAENAQRRRAGGAQSMLSGNWQGFQREGDAGAPLGIG